MAEAAQGGLTHPSIQSRQLEENLGNRLQGIGRGGPPGSSRSGQKMWTSDTSKFFNLLTRLVWSLEFS